MQLTAKEAIVKKPGEISEADVPITTRPLLQNEVMVRLDAAPFNPVDFYFAKKMFEGQPEPPFRLGVEGLGTIESVGQQGFSDLINKKCLFITRSGSCATHLILQRNEVYVLGDDVNMASVKENFAMNPLTAFALIEKAKAQKASVIIHTAASSNVGKWITLLAKEEGIKTIAVVRSDKHSQELTALGATSVLSSGDKLFDLELKTTLLEYKPTVLLDALGGDLPTNILADMPAGSLMVSYGHMQNSEITGVNLKSLIMSKSITSFIVLYDFMPMVPGEAVEKLINKFYTMKQTVVEPVQVVPFDHASSLIAEWPKKKARLVLKV